MTALIEETGNTYGRLTVLGPDLNSHRSNGGRVLRWRCRCSCGNETLTRGDRLRGGATTSCGRCGFTNQSGYRRRMVDGRVEFEHRRVLRDKIGPGENQCYWCGVAVSWSVDPREPGGLQTDHLNSVRDDNRPENLVPSCLTCNVRRGRHGIELTPYSERR